MTKAELLTALEPIPDDLTIWLGVDAGEGYIHLDDVFSGTSFHLPLDLDEAGDEFVYEENLDNVTEPYHYTWIDDAWSKEVIILGARDSLKDYLKSIKDYKNRDADKKAEMEQYINSLKSQLLHAENELKELNK